MLKFFFPLLFLFSGTLEKAPDFDFVHENGEIQTLSDYDGNVVYVAFWASWCQPCLSNFKKYNEMRKVLQEKGVTLLNVSLDKKESDWQKALQSYSFLNGENVHVSDLGKVMNLYQLSYIPEYKILNKQREIVNLDQEQNRDIVAAFEKWLKE